MNVRIDITLITCVILSMIIYNIIQIFKTLQKCVIILDQVVKICCPVLEIMCLNLACGILYLDALCHSQNRDIVKFFRANDKNVTYKYIYLFPQKPQSIVYYVHLICMKKISYLHI